MNDEQAARLSASLFRQLYLMRMLHYEYAFFITMPAPSGIKNALYQGKQSYDRVILQLRAQMPISRDRIEKELNMSDEKIRALSTIMEKLCALPEADVLEMEDQFNEAIVVDYKKGEA